MSYKNVGLVWTAQSLQQYLSQIKAPDWCKAICLHHTAAPSLQQRPRGFAAQHIINMRDFYIDKGWKSGPHLYIDEDQIFGMTPLTEKGVHAVSFNATSIGIEVLGDYDEENPFSDRGLQCWQNAAACVNVLLKWLDIKADAKTILFHRDDPKTSKTCPGTKISKNWFLDMLLASPQGNAQDIDKIKDFMPVLQYVIDNKGYDAAAAGKLIVKKSGMFYFGDDWLEGAYYDATKQCTMAPLKELQQIKPNC